MQHKLSCHFSATVWHLPSFFVFFPVNFRIIACKLSDTKGFGKNMQNRDLGRVFYLCLALWLFGFYSSIVNCFVLGGIFFLVFFNAGYKAVSAFVHLSASLERGAGRGRE